MRGHKEEKLGKETRRQKPGLSITCTQNLSSIITGKETRRKV